LGEIGVSLNNNDIQKLYSQLGLVLDGLWFLEVEKEVGFEKAYKIDEAVWRKYSQKEAQRIKKLLNIEIPTTTDIQKILSLSLFNQTLDYELKQIQTNPVVIRFTVKKCKSFDGMTKIGRPKDQIHKICFGIETATLEGFFQGVMPTAKIRCVYCPFENAPNLEGVCAWDITL
jgi:hypothetical protein